MIVLHLLVPWGTILPSLVGPYWWPQRAHHLVALVGRTNPIIWWRGLESMPPTTATTRIHHATTTTKKNHATKPRNHSDNATTIGNFSIYKVGGISCRLQFHFSPPKFPSSVDPARFLCSSPFLNCDQVENILY